MEGSRDLALISPSGITAEALSERRRRLRAIALMCGACACFACLDASAKFLNGHIDSLQVVWARYASAFFLTFLISNPLTRPRLIATTRPMLQIGRSLLLLFSTLLNVLALKYLQLDQTVSILFSTPFFVTLLSGFLLGEWAGWRRWAAIGVGFSGVLLIARPGFGGMHPAALLCVAGAICYSFYNVSTRVLARTDSNETTLFYSNFVGTVAALPALPFVWTTPHDPVVIALMVLIGAFGSFGHYLLIVAHRLASATVLAPFIYTQLIWASTAGYLVFGQLPSEWTLAGAAIVIGSGLYILYREHKLKG